MSNRSEPQVAAETCVALGATDAQVTSYANREVALGTLAVSRALPIKDRRLVGPWCFLDRFGPLTFSEGKPMDVAPHPHIGLQTVTWLVRGEVLHSDSLGSESVLRPGGVNVMTSGGGIAHAEETPRDHTGRLDGVQLWVALPERDRHMAPGFAHVAEVPTIELPGGRAFYESAFDQAPRLTTRVGACGPRVLGAVQGLARASRQSGSVHTLCSARAIRIAGSRTQGSPSIRAHARGVAPRDCAVSSESHRRGPLSVAVRSHRSGPCSDRTRGTRAWTRPV